MLKSRTMGVEQAVKTPAGALSDDEVAHLQPVLQAYAARAIGDREAARDLVQETLLATITGRARFEGRAQLRTWAVGILTHKVIDHLRARKRASNTITVDDASTEDLAEPSSQHRPDRVLARTQALSVLDAGIRELPELERLAVLMIDVEGLDREEAARHLAVTPTHLRVLLHRGRHRLRRALESAGVTHDA